MAAIARRNFGGLRDEAKLRLAKTDAGAALSTRIEYLIYEAYLDLALTFHHFELHKESSGLACSTTNNVIALPADCYATMSVRLRAVTGNRPLGPLTYAHTDTIYAGYTDDASDQAQPRSYTRVGSNLLVNTRPDQAYPIDLLYYKRPDAPDFASDSSELDVLWDHYIIQHALAMAYPAVFRFDMAQVPAEELRTFLARAIHPGLGEEPPQSPRLRPLDIARRGGGQG